LKTPKDVLIKTDPEILKAKKTDYIEEALEVIEDEDIEETIVTTNSPDINVGLEIIKEESIEGTVTIKKSEEDQAPNTT
jgi:hypothetical protein